MRLVTYNLHLGGRRGGGVHWDRMHEEFAPDIIFAQEATRPIGLANRGLQGIWRRVEGREWGSAVVVRGEILEEITLPSNPGWIVGANVQIESGQIYSAISLHAPTMKGRSFTNVLEDIVGEIAALKLKHPLVLGGDMNLVSVGDRQPGELVETTPSEKGFVQRVRNDLGLVSCWSTAHPGEVLPQTLRWSRNPEIPYHCDVLFVPHNWTIESCEIPDGKPWIELSDHSPVFATVEPLGAKGGVRTTKPAQARRPASGATLLSSAPASIPAPAPSTAPAAATTPPAAPQPDKTSAKTRVETMSPKARPETASPTRPAAKTSPAKAAPTKPAPTKAAPTKAAPTKAAPTKAAPTKAAPKKSPSKTTPVTKSPAKKAPAKKAPATKAPVKKVPAKKAPAKKSAPKKGAAKRTPMKTAPAKKAPAKKVAGKKGVARKPSGSKGKSR